LLLSYAVFSFGPYLVWPSRWNVVGHVQLGFFFVAYFVPLLWTDPVGSIGHGTVYLYTSILVLGAGSYLLGLPLGFLSPRFSLTRRRLVAMPVPEYSQLFRNRVVKVALCATIGLLLSFVIMGYVPMFASIPMQAKYYHGEYQAGYLRARALLRPSFLGLVWYLPLLVVICGKTKRIRYSLLLFVGLAAAGATLDRGDVGIAVIAGAGILMAQKRSRAAFVAYLGAVVLVMWVGTLGNYLLNVYLSIRTGDFRADNPVAELVADGAPDVREGLKFFDNFEDQHEPFTYGAHFIAGLVPVQTVTMAWIPLARYHPNLWALGILYGTDDQKFIRASASGGGLRMVAPISGYCGLGWLGVVVMSALSGFINGYLARFAKTYAGRGSLAQSAVVVTMYLALYRWVGDPCTLVWEGFIPVAALLWLIYPVRARVVRVERAWPAPSPILS